MITARESVEINAPYVLRNQTGLPLVVVVDGQRLRTTDDSLSEKSPARDAAAFHKSQLTAHVIQPDEVFGLYDVLMNRTVSL